MDKIKTWDDRLNNWKWIYIILFWDFYILSAVIYFILPKSVFSFGFIVASFGCAIISVVYYNIKCRRQNGR